MDEILELLRASDDNKKCVAACLKLCACAWRLALLPLSGATGANAQTFVMQVSGPPTHDEAAARRGPGERGGCAQRRGFRLHQQAAAPVARQISEYLERRKSLIMIFVAFQ